LLPLETRTWPVDYKKKTPGSGSVCSQRTQIIRHIAEFPNHVGIAEIARGGIPPRQKADICKTGFIDGLLKGIPQKSTGIPALITIEPMDVRRSGMTGTDLPALAGAGRRRGATGRAGFH
jgi:hypothetical protein